VDGLDGLAAGSALFSTLTVVVISLVNGRVMIGFVGRARLPFPWSPSACPSWRPASRWCVASSADSPCSLPFSRRSASSWSARAKDARAVVIVTRPALHGHPARERARIKTGNYGPGLADPPRLLPRHGCQRSYTADLDRPEVGTRALDEPVAKTKDLPSSF